MSRYEFPLAFICLCALWTSIHSVELTFELADNERQCFYEQLQLGSKFVLEFQVISGGERDVDVQLKDPSNEVIYEDSEKEYDHVERDVKSAGVYEFCFNNEFSTFTHKVIYIDWQVDGDPEHEINGSRSQGVSGPLTLMESNVENIHKNLEKTIDYQTHHRLRESSGRIQAEELNERVQIWSLGQFCLIIVVSIGTVMFLRSFFPDRKYPSNNAWYR